MEAGTLNLVILLILLCSGLALIGLTFAFQGAKRESCLKALTTLGGLALLIGFAASLSWFCRFLSTISISGESNPGELAGHLSGTLTTLILYSAVALLPFFVTFIHHFIRSFNAR
jgi:hypothetical protein